MSGMLSGRRAVVIVCGLLQGLVVLSLTSRFFVNSHLDHFSGLDSCVLAYCGSSVPLLSLQSFYNYETALARSPRTVLGYVGKKGWGVEGYWCFRKWVQ